MKSKITTFILFLIMIFLIGFIGLFLFIIYTDTSIGSIKETISMSNSSVSVGDETTVSSTQGKKSIGEAISDLFTSSKEENTTTNYSTESSKENYFYKQLSDTQKLIYNGLQENKENMISGRYKIQYGDKFSEILSQENGSEILGEDYQAAIEAYTHDNPDLFYIDITKMYLNIETTKKAWKTTYDVCIAPEEGKTYYEDAFTSEEQVRTAISKIEYRKNLILKRLTGNKYEDIKIIHDYLVENIEYDKKYESKGTYTIYGALIDGKCVCEGYSRAFKYLANEAGIECLLMQGTATNSTGETESHAWNCVKLEESWYYIDCTWDDPIIIGNGYVSASTKYKYFLKGASSFSKEHILENKFTDEGREFDYPIISVTDY